VGTTYSLEFRAGHTSKYRMPILSYVWERCFMGKEAASAWNSVHLEALESKNGLQIPGVGRFPYDTATWSEAEKKWTSYT
jgi:hypothetical protein